MVSTFGAFNDALGGVQLQVSPTAAADALSGIRGVHPPGARPYADGGRHGHAGAPDGGKGGRLSRRTPVGPRRAGP